MVIDARDQGCPKPVMIAEEALSKIRDGIVEVTVDNEASADNLAWFAKNNAFFSETIRGGKDWRVKMMTAVEKATEAENGFPFVIGTDTMGKEEALGRILMKAYFETMKTYRQLPHTIFFLNAGVKLTTTIEEIFTILKDIEAMGAEIYSCGTCLKHYGLEESLKVGHGGTTNHIVEGVREFDKTVWRG